jgi:hypothetical protein
MKGLEEIKKILADGKLHVYLGIIQKLHLASDRSYLKVTVSVLPENRNIISTITWENVGEDSGDFEFPAPGDLVLLVNAEGDDDSSYVIKRLSSRVDKIPQAAADGDKVHRARTGNKYWNVSDTNIFLARGDDAPTENLVLGQVFKQFAQDFLEICKTYAQNSADHKHIGNLGYFTAKPDIENEFLARKTAYNGIEDSPIKDEAILSDLSFTEK